MATLHTDRFIRQAQAAALLALPSLLLLVFVLHFRSVTRFFVFRLRYEPRPAENVVHGLMAAGRRMPLIHDPHVLAYLAVPLFTLCAFGLYALSRQVRPAAAAVGLALTVTGTIYLGGLFGMWTAFYDGIARVDPRFVDGAIATFAAETAPQGAFLLTSSLARLALLGLGVQILNLWGIPTVAKWAVLLATLGCALIIAFWDLDNWMLIGAALMLAGFIPIRSSVQATV
jgi:hypothetical protein